MNRQGSLPSSELEEQTALVAILEGTASRTGHDFFRALVENLAKALNTQGAWVTEYLEDCRRLRALAFWMEGEWIADYEIDIEGTPCEAVIETQDIVRIPDNLVELYPDDPDIAASGSVSYLGAPLMDLDGRILGHLAVVDRRPLPDEAQYLAIFRIFAARAAAELQRLRAETEIRRRELKLSRLLDSAFDSIVEFDDTTRVTLINSAAEKTFGLPASSALGISISDLFSEESAAQMESLIRELDSRPEGSRFLWAPGGLTALSKVRGEVQVEATLSRFVVGRKVYHTLILRDVEDRLAAERMIRSLTLEKEYLREEIRGLRSDGEILGESPAIRRVLEDMAQVARTDSTVLILGETGTGKELIARALHNAGNRSGKPLVKVNCAAIPASLMESEFFGHEKGAFTGATQRREGRFALADGGTLFLDEVGELPLDLQAKLLRVLQEGEFEPVGAVKTRKVDVRLIAATNRDLLDLVRRGEFREDLYYRLHVFPISVPPLRDRREDIRPLAEAFIARLAKRWGRRIEPLSPEAVRRLEAYNWPGNVRELENVIERGLITSTDGRLNLDRALPEATASSGTAEPEPNPDQVLTVSEMQAVERENLIRALERTGWKVSGEGGAAALLGMKPTTLASRIKALSIARRGDHNLRG